MFPDSGPETYVLCALPQVIPPDSFLGPASGKQTVYEQRAKLLFALDKAQARTTQQSM